MKKTDDADGNDCVIKIKWNITDILKKETY